MTGESKFRGVIGDYDLVWKFCLCRLQWEAYGNLDSFYEAISGRYDKLVATGSDCIPSGHW